MEPVSEDIQKAREALKNRFAVSVGFLWCCCKGLGTRRKGNGKTHKESGAQKERFWRCQAENEPEQGWLPPYR